jgi:predicted ATPase
MKILRLDIENFRSLRKVSWFPGDLNLIIGPNASGKSNLLQALELLAVAASGGLSEFVRQVGGMEPLVWDGAEPGFSIRLRTSPPFPNRDDRDSLTYSLELARIGLSSAFRIDCEELANYHRVENGGSRLPLRLLERKHQRARVFDPSEKSLTAPEEAIPEEETLLSLAAGPFTANPIISAFQQEMSQWAVYQGLRTDRAAPVRQAALARHESGVAWDGSNLVSVLHTLYTGRREFEETVDAAMLAAFGEDYERLVFPPAADGRVQLRVRWRSLRREQTAADLSDGMLRFLFLLAVLANPTPPGLLAIDEPEAGLHPSMLPIVAEHARDAALRCQVILTTHSAELLDAFTAARPSTSVTHRENGETAIRVVSGDLLEHWLREYTLGRIYRSGELEAMEAAG